MRGSLGFLFLSLLIFSCSHHESMKEVRFVGEAQGTYYSIIYFDAEARHFQPAVDSILKGFDQSVSLWVPNSILSRVNQNDPDVRLDGYFIDNFQLSQEIARETDGFFDMTVGSLVRAWGFGFDATKSISTNTIDSILEFTGYEKVRWDGATVIKEDNRTTFDFNAVAQGYSVDLLCMFLEDQGIKSYLVDIGGEVRGKGIKPNGDHWKVGIEKPAKEKSSKRDLKAIIALDDKAIATSGNYRKFYEEEGIRYSHTINPKTGFPVQHSLLSVTVMAETTALADAYATAFMVMGLEKSKEFLSRNDDLEAFFIYSNEAGEYESFATERFSNQITKTFE